METPKIYGFNRSSDAGFNKFCPSVFVKGCNLRCPYCMNVRLVNENISEIDIGILDAFIRDNNPEMVMISGGEPLYEMENTFALVSFIRERGCKVGMSTNGIILGDAKKDGLFTLLNRLSYIALDIKGSLLEYKNMGDAKDFLRVWKALEIIRSKRILDLNFNYEIRTTLFPTMVTEETIRHLSAMLNNGETWILQQFRQTREILDSFSNKVSPYSEKEIETLLGLARRLSKAKVDLRYV